MDNLQTLNLFDFISNYDTKTKSLKRYGYTIKLNADDDAELQDNLKRQIGEKPFDFINAFMVTIAKKPNWSFKDTIPYLKEILINPLAYNKDILTHWNSLKEFFQWYDNIYLIDKRNDTYNTLIYADNLSVEGVRNKVIEKVTIFILRQLESVKLEANKHYTAEPFS